MVGHREEKIVYDTGYQPPTPPPPLTCSGSTPNPDPIAQASGAPKLEEKKEVLVRGLPPGGIVIASGDNSGMKKFSAKELEAAIRHGVALKATPVLPLGTGMCRCPYPQPFHFFQIDSH